MIRALIAERTDPVLFELSYDYVGDLSETVALMWPADPQREKIPKLRRLCRKSSQPWPRSARRELPAQLARWLDALDETGRWALLKLVTGELRVGVSARLAKTAAAALGDKDADEIEVALAGPAPPYLDLFAWLEGRADKPASQDPAPFRPPMLAHAIEESDLAALDPADYMRGMEMGRHSRAGRRRRRRDGGMVARLYSRTGEDISGELSRSAGGSAFDGAIDGELLIMRDGRVQSFNVLQQRLNRKAVTPKLLADFPAHLRAYDLLARRRARTCAACLSRSGARGSKSFVARAGRPAHRPLAARAVHHLGRACRGARRSGAAEQAPMRTRSKA